MMSEKFWSKISSTHRYFFKISSSACQYFLIRNDIVIGQYLVRPSDSNLNGKSVTISVRAGASAVSNFEIFFDQNDGCWLIENCSQKFHDLSSLLHHYRANNLPGLALKLTFPVLRDQLPTMQSIIIPTAQLYVGEMLGEGSFGKVYLGRFAGLKVAIKKPSRRDPTFAQEASLLASLTHENVVRMLGLAGLEQNDVWIVTEFMNGGCLWDFLQKRGEHICLENVFFFLREIINGMIYLGERNVIHRDLRTSNVLTRLNKPQNDMEIKLSDFGLTRHLPNGRAQLVYTGSVFPVRWTAPEAMNSGLFSEKSDVWSFGCLIFEIVTLGKYPYPTLSDYQVEAHVTTREPPISYSECISSNRFNVGFKLMPADLYNNAMQKCLLKNASARPSFRELKNIINVIESNNSGGLG